MFRKKIIIILATILISTSIALAQLYTSSNYTISSTKIIVSAGRANSASYTLNNIEIGNIISGKAQSANYTLQAGYFLTPSTIAISVIPQDWPLNTVKTSTSNINNTNKIIVKNEGDLKITYSLQVIDVTNSQETSPWSSGNTISENKYVMSAVFTDSNAADIDVSDFASEDILLEGPQQSTNTKFAIPSSSKNGVGVMSGEERALWLKFDAPAADVTQDQHKQHTIRVFISAEK